MDIPVSRLNKRMALQLPPELPLGLVFVVGNLITQADGGSSTMRVVCGLLMSMGGLLLSVWAKRTLGSNYSPCFAAAPPTRRVDSGPYAFLTHPIYVGNLLILGGWFLQSLSIVIFSVWLHWAAAYLVSARVESRHLPSGRGALT